MRNGGNSGNRDWPWSHWSAVKTLLIINCLIYILCNMGTVGEELCFFLSLNRMGIQHYQLWRPFTYMFTHMTFMHIFGNMWSLWIFGSLLEPALGKTRFYKLYLFSGLIGAATWLLANWWGEPAICIGASGSVFGIMVATAMSFPHAKLQLIIPPISLKMRTFAILYCLYEIYAELSINDNVAHLAHLGGALGAIIFMRRLLKRSSFQNNPSCQWLKNIFRMKNEKKDNSSHSSNSLGELDSNEVDRVLDKLAATGRSSLTQEEKALLEEASRRLRDN